MTMDLFFPTSQSVLRLYKKKPNQLVDYFLNYKGSGSLLMDLKNLGYATSLESSLLESDFDFSIVWVRIILTEQGIFNYKQVLAIFFEFLNSFGTQLQNSQSGLFSQAKEIANLKFLWKEKENPFDFVEQLSVNLQEYPPEHILVGPYLFLEDHFTIYEPKEFVDVNLNIRNVRVHISTKLRDNTTDLKCCSNFEKWYNSSYSEFQFPQLQPAQKQWPSNTIWNRNEFIPTNFSLLLPNLTEQQKEATKPKLVMSWQEGNSIQLWHLANHWDRAFVQWRFVIRSMRFQQSAGSAALTYVWIFVLNDLMQELLAKSIESGYEISSFLNNEGLLEIRLNGFSDKIDLVIKEICKTLFAESISMEEGRLEIILEQVKRDLGNLNFRAPYLQANANLRLLTNKSQWNHTEILNSMPTSLPELMFKFESFRASVLTESHFEVFVGGNIPHDFAISTHKHIQQQMIDSFLYATTNSTGELGKTPYIPSRITKLPRGSDIYIRRASSNPRELNNGVVNYYQLSSTNETVAIAFELFWYMSKQPFFDDLRTKQQLGYIVGSRIDLERTSKSISFIVQSSVQTPLHIDKSIENFIDSFCDQIADAQDSFVDEYVKSLISLKLEKPKTLTEQMDLFWSEITTMTYDFERLGREVNILKQLSKMELIDVCSSFLLPTIDNTNQRRKVSSLVYAQAEEIKQESIVLKSNNGHLIREINEQTTTIQSVKSGLELSPLTRNEFSVDEDKWTKNLFYSMNYHGTDQKPLQSWYPVIFFVQTVLIAVCGAFALYVYFRNFRFSKRSKQEEKYIQLEMQMKRKD